MVSETITQWVPGPRDFKRFEDWKALATRTHANFRFVEGLEPPLAQLRRPLSESVVALVSTAGIHRSDQEPFDTKSAHGDWSYREIPLDTPDEMLQVSHTHFNHAAADEDINCLYPLQRLRELAAEAHIRAVAPINYGLMGFVPNPDPIVNETAPAIAHLLAQQGVDAVIMTPG